VDFDDESQRFLLAFGPPAAAELMHNLEQTPFELFDRTRTRKRGNTVVRTDQGQFNFKVFQRYGSVCAVCPINVREMLDAAHLCPYGRGGSDDARNGLVLCKSHHAAFDAGLFAIQPTSLKIILLRQGLSLQSLRIERSSIAHLRVVPDIAALTWTYNYARKQAARRDNQRDQQRRYRAKQRAKQTLQPPSGESIDSRHSVGAMRFGLNAAMNATGTSDIGTSRTTNGPAD
jgi:hypothetical protein